MVHKFVLLISALVMSFALWFLLEKTHPVFGSEDVLSESRQAGGMSAEMTEVYKSELFKSDLISFGMWGAALGGFCGFGAFGVGRHKFAGLGIGLAAGAASGALAAYLGTFHELRNEYSGASAATYWMARWAALSLPIAIAAGLAAGVGAGGGAKRVTDSTIAALVGAIMAIVGLVLLVGLVTPVERHELVFPAFYQTRLLAVFIVNLAVVSMLILQVKMGGEGRARARVDADSESGLQSNLSESSR